MYELPDKRMFVKITAGARMGGNPCIYYRNDLRPDLFFKWQWYFEYRAALYKINNPKHNVRIDTGSYDYTPPKEERLNKLKRKIPAKKRSIGKIERNMIRAKNDWTDLFQKIEDTGRWKKVEAMLKRYKEELREMENELELLKQ